MQDTGWPQHASAEEERVRQLVVVNVLQEDQDHRVPAGFDHLVKSMVGCKSGQEGRIRGLSKE